MAPEGFDIVIVGAGAAGCVLARRLAEGGDRAVLLIEAGPDLRREGRADLRDGWRLPTVPDWGFESEPDATGTSGRLRRGRLLGGTSWLTRFAVRGAASDFDRWAANGTAGWSFEEVLPAFRRLETDIDFGDRPWHGAEGPMPVTRYLDRAPSEIHAAAIDAAEALGFARIDDHNAPDAIGVGSMPMSSRAGERVTTLDAYLPDGSPASNMTIRSDTVVARVKVEAGRATGVQCVDGTEIRAGLVILSAGTYGSPPILLRSGIGPADDLHSLGIEVRIDLPGVGRNLADHPAVDLPSGWKGNAQDGPSLHSIATFRSSTAASADGPDLMFWVSDPEGDDAAFYLDPVLLRPRSRGSVKLRSADPTDAPRIALPGPSDPADVERLIEATRVGVELAHRREIRRLCTEAPPELRGTAGLRQYVIENAYSIPHVVGTCAMGPSPERGAVVDAHGRVHGVDRLIVADASIIPEPPSGFPHIITVMIAERVAELISGVA